MSIAARRSGGAPVKFGRLLRDSAITCMAGQAGAGQAGPFGDSIGALFSTCAALHRNETAIVCEGRRVSYGELDRAAGNICRSLLRAGVGKGEPVGLVAHRSIEAVVAMLGIIKAGGAYLPLDMSYPTAMLRHICDDARPALTLVARSLHDSVSLGPFWSGTTLYIESDLSLSGSMEAGGSGRWRGPDGAEPLEREVGPDDLAYIMYTSGSTGRPKGVMVPHRGVIRLVSDCDFVSLDASEVILHLAPLSFDASTLEIWGALLNGGRLAIVRAAMPTLDEIADAIRDYGATTLWLTAGLFHLMVDRRIDGLRPLRQLIAGGDVLSVPHVAKAMAALPRCRTVNGYGPTENTTFTCCYTVPRDVELAGSLPIGTAIRGTVVYVLDDEMKPVPDGQEGELYAGGAGVALGYLNQPELTAEKFIDDPFGGRSGARLYRTGDRVRRRADGNIEFLGRADRQVKINGKRVELDAIEACLHALHGVRDVAVISRADSAGRRSAVAFVTLGEGVCLTQGELRAALRSDVPDFMVPAEIVVLAALPLTSAGKIDRGRLAEAYPEIAASPGAVLTGGNQTSRALQQIWCRVLGVESVGVDDNFFDLGGTSLQLIEVHARITEQFDMSVAVVDLFAHPSIRGLASRLDGTRAAAPASLSGAERAHHRSAALAQALAVRSRRGVRG
ncbi:MAG TPA: non-ribosomal peptide synthetase [Acetobacteraceae bacterium]